MKTKTKEFADAVYKAYLRGGSKLRNTVLMMNGVEGVLYLFEENNVEVACNLVDYSFGDWHHRLDEIEPSIDLAEFQDCVNSCAYALGCKTNELILASMSGTPNLVGSGTDGLTESKAMAAIEAMDRNGVPDDGRRYAVVGWDQWQDLRSIPGFACAHVELEDMMHTHAKQWRGVLWMRHSNMPKTDDGISRCFMYHSAGVGHAVGDSVRIDVVYHEMKLHGPSYYVVKSMKQGSCLIDPDSVVEMRCRVPDVSRKGV